MRQRELVVPCLKHEHDERDKRGEKTLDSAKLKCLNRKAPQKDVLLVLSKEDGIETVVVADDEAQSRPYPRSSLFPAYFLPTFWHMK